VVYRETITAPACVSEVYDRDLGGERQAGQVNLSVAPNPRGSGNTFMVEAPPEEVPAELHAVLGQAVEESLASGVVLGYPTVDAGVKVTGGRFIPGVSTSLGFRLACTLAVKKALEQGQPVLLQPVMKVEVVAPEEFMGEVIGDLNSRGGTVEAIEPKGSSSVIRALIPLAAMFGYSTDLRSATQGRAIFTMQFSHYDRAPENKKTA
jgi:elongation factor G